MSNLSIPFNISILELTEEKLKGIRPVRVLDIFDSNKQFHEDGLFSSLIFGRVGDEVRDYRFSYIDNKLQFFHPILFNCLIQLKSLYEGIMAGKEYAVWNDELKDFERSTAFEGKTGFNFFLQHWESIVFKETNSDLRDQFIQLVNKYKDVAFIDKMVVLPAGLRDLEFNDNGRVEENEINNLYRRIIAIANTVNQISIKQNPESLDTVRWSLQCRFNEIFETFKAVIEGKKKLITGKWASRKIFNGTRNVITAMDPSTEYLGDPNAVGFNDTIIGLFQFMKGTLPMTRYYIRNEILPRIFISRDRPVNLVNKKTLKMVEVKLSASDYDRWTSDEGVEKIIDGFGEEFFRHKPVEVNGHYIALIYKGPDGTFKIIQDIDDVPEGRNKEDVFPITYCELLYLSVYKHSHEFPLFTTRYPIAGRGSIYPSLSFLKTTVKGEVRYELNDNWEVDKTHCANEFPIANGKFLNSFVPHPSRVKGLVAD